MILDRIVADKKLRLREAEQKHPFSEIRREAEQVLLEQERKEDCSGNSFYEALRKPGLSIIGEFKQASPSRGAILSHHSLKEQIEAYNSCVDAISCLTEEDHFHGSTGYLREIRQMSALPILRKDFMIAEYQIYEAKAIGSDAILLIAAILDDKRMQDFYDLAGELKLNVLVETHDERELERALRIGADLIGVNNRDLRDFSIRLDTTKRLAKLVPRDKVLVAESGILGDEDIRYLMDCRVDACLIGSALMEAEHPGERALHWKRLGDGRGGLRNDGD